MTPATTAPTIPYLTEAEAERLYLWKQGYQRVSVAERDLLEYSGGTWVADDQTAKRLILMRGLYRLGKVHS